MEPIVTVRSATTSTIRATARARSTLRSERTKIVSRVNAIEGRRRELEGTRAESVAFVRLLKSVLWIPFVRKAVIDDYRLRIETSLEADAKLAIEVEKIRADSVSLETMSTRVDRLTGLLVKAERAIPALGAVPKAVEDLAVDIDFRVGRLLASGSGGPWVARVLDEAEAVVAMVRDWARLRMKSPVPLIMSSGTVKRPGPARRIYLPIPFSMGDAAKGNGALKDPDAPKGTSPWYVTSDSDISRLKNLLPLAYRGTTKFEFPPIPYKASGQNLWGIFDRDSWNRIRSASYAQSGHRCVICGGRGGFIADKVMDEAEKRHGVDCHEVWEWNVEDPATGVGIQKLNRMLVVCASCHACFHSGYFGRQARQRGMEDEVKDFIEKRRMSINRVTQDELHEDLDRTRNELLRIQGIDKWVIDLESLGRQQYMLDHVPVLKERNMANVTAGLVAGLAFETDGGEVFESRSAADIYAELCSMDEVDIRTPVR